MSTTQTPERIRSLRERMASEHIDALIIPTGDYHLSEYCAPFFGARKYITGFTGSAGTAVITQKEAGLWTDSRYYLQAEKQLEGTGIVLYRMQEPGVPAIPNWLAGRLQAEQTVAFDGRLVSCRTFDQWKKKLDRHGIRLRDDCDLVGAIWEDRPALPMNPVFDYDIAYAGRSRAEKLAEIREDMRKAEADYLFLSGLSDIAWLLNLRGSDVHCNPVFLAFLLMDANYVYLFAQEDAFSPELVKKLEADGIRLEAYDAVLGVLSELPTGSAIWLSSAENSCGLRNAVSKKSLLIDRPSPTGMHKAVKNETEQAGTRQAHLRDGVAVTKWIFWLKQQVGKAEITEISAAEKLYEFRAEQDLFMGNSFDPIIGYGPHAAIVHYFATAESDVPLQPSGLLLADTGGQYLDGTTDITRTIALGPLTDEERRMFTAVLRGHIALASAVFPEGVTGSNLDVLAHLPLWNMGKDYGHGTGHGVGHFLNVHEGPNHFHWNDRGARGKTPAMQAGMITSDEPGYYEAGSFGIRHESLLLCVNLEETAFGKFLGFEELTLVPFDRDAIDPEQLTHEERAYLDRYHQTVFESLSPYLEPSERAWLEKATRPL
ncbi:MAG: aminopeptidase P family protein [Mogibacterium sp.]|nr:aminopeptidase P family protein [Mogibacterium sp.]